MEFSLGSAIHVLVSKFNEYPSIGLRKCMVKNGRVIPTKEGVNLILPQYRELKNQSSKIMVCLDSNDTLEVDLGYRMVVKCGKNDTSSSHQESNAPGKVTFYNNFRNKDIKLTVAEFKKLVELEQQVEEAITFIRDQCEKEKCEKIDFTSQESAQIESLFVLCYAAIARRHFSQRYPCLGCHHNRPFYGSWHSCSEVEDVNILTGQLMDYIKQLSHLPHKVSTPFKKMMSVRFQSRERFVDQYCTIYQNAFMNTIVGRQHIYNVVMKCVEQRDEISNDEMGTILLCLEDESICDMAKIFHSVDA